ncbi:MAG: LytTR family transcriptional regulator [Bacteroidales bacterium]|nr:LytTR family transcriptional regulator [Bacteroidales bacterium]
MKKALIIIAYWIAAMFVTALILVSLDYDLGQALLMSLTFLPSAMALSFFLPKVDRTKNRTQRILDSVYIILGVMSSAFLLIFFIQFQFFSFIGPYGYRDWSLPSMLGNPVFIAAILAILAYGHYVLVKWLDQRFPSTKPITFNSEHRKVSLKKEDILYVESRDSEVWIVARDGQSYRNRNGITQWENLLGPSFLRIHRAFLVNVAESTLSTPETVTVGGKELPVSRKYKEIVKGVFSQVSE